MKISNFNSLAASPERKAALLIAEAGLQAIDTRLAIDAAIRLHGDQLSIGELAISLAGVNRIFLLGIGKCALDASEALEKILGSRLHDGIVLGVGESALGRFKKVKVFLGTHPLPSEKNMAASRAMVAMLEGLQENDLVVAIVSGGGSTLLCLPPEGASCEEEAKILQHLFKTGANIREINTIRKHLSLARGGYLAKYAYPSQMISLIFSDVPGNDLGFISSGPTVRDTTSVSDARALLKKYDILSVPGFADIELIETPQEEKYFERVQNILFVSNGLALAAMADKAKELDYNPVICTDELSGEAREVGRQMARELRESPAKTVRLYGGETTVTAKMSGQGGRCQELALGALEFIESGEVILALASDGRDNTDAAGAICDTIIDKEAHRQGVNQRQYLDRHDSYAFFKEIGGHIITGHTGSNVSDLLIALKN